MSQVQKFKQAIGKAASYARARRALLKYDLKLAIRNVTNFLRRQAPAKGIIQNRVPVRTIRRIMKRRNLAIYHGDLSWWYTWAYERGDTDPLTNYALAYIREQITKDASILITGCGTGISLFHLIDAGFARVDGFDYLEPCVIVDNDIAKIGNYKCHIWQADGFSPKLEHSYDVVLAQRWVYSAWGGNYENQAIPYEQAKTAVKREELLTDFISQYAPHMNPGGVLIVELIDAVADYRVSLDYGRSYPLDTVYPVRHTPEQVASCAQRTGFEVVDYKLSTNNPQPTTCYILRKSNQ